MTIVSDKAPSDICAARYLTFMLCSNIPKFLAPDIPLFEAILRDLFPGVTVPSVDYGTVQVILEIIATYAAFAGHLIMLTSLEFAEIYRG